MCHLLPFGTAWEVRSLQPERHVTLKSLWEPGTARLLSQTTHSCGMAPKGKVPRRGKAATPSKAGQTPAKRKQEKPPSLQYESTPAVPRLVASTAAASCNHGWQVLPATSLARPPAPQRLPPACLCCWLQAGPLRAAAPATASRVPTGPGGPIVNQGVMRRAGYASGCCACAQAGWLAAQCSAVRVVRPWPRALCALPAARSAAKRASADVDMQFTRPSPPPSCVHIHSRHSNDAYHSTPHTHP